MARSIILLGAAVAAFSSVPASTFTGASITLAWNQSTDADVVAYNLYYGGASQTYTNVVPVGNVTNATAVGLVPGATYYFSVTSVDSAGMESEFSTEVSGQVKGILVVTANDQSRIYGAADPVLTGTLTGLQNGDNITATYSTVATAASPIGSYSIVPSLNDPDGKLTNYAFTLINGQLEISPASTINAVSSSANPSPTGSNVTFTTDLTPISPGSGTPTGTVQFLADATPLGSPVALAGGIASLTTSSLSHGTHAITTRYTGDGNFFGSTNSLSPNESINGSPFAANYSFARYRSSGAKVRVGTLLSNDTDPDYDVLALSSVTPISAAGGTVVVSNTWVFYTPPAGFTNPDAYSYVIADTGGLQATGSVSIAIVLDFGPSQNVVAIQDLGGGAALIQFQGIPGRAYTIQYTDSLDTPAWLTLGTSTADTTGGFAFTDTSAAGRFYHSTYP
jgi:hypothetical protein